MHIIVSCMLEVPASQFFLQQER